MNAAPAGSSSPDLAGPRRREGWSPARWLILIALVYAAHAGLVFLFGERTPPTPRPVIHVPALLLADRTNELRELRDPTGGTRRLRCGESGCGGPLRKPPPWQPSFRMKKKDTDRK